MGENYYADLAEDHYAALDVQDEAAMSESPFPRPWCHAQGPCRCFGTVAPSTALRDPEHPLKPACADFDPDRGVTTTLRDLK